VIGIPCVQYGCMTVRYLSGHEGDGNCRSLGWSISAGAGRYGIPLGHIACARSMCPPKMHHRELCQTVVFVHGLMGYSFQLARIISTFSRSVGMSSRGRFSA